MDGDVEMGDGEQEADKNIAKDDANEESRGNTPGSHVSNSSSLTQQESSRASSPADGDQSGEGRGPSPSTGSTEVVVDTSGGGQRTNKDVAKEGTIEGENGNIDGTEGHGYRLRPRKPVADTQEDDYADADTGNKRKVKHQYHRLWIVLLCAC